MNKPVLILTSQKDPSRKNLTKALAEHFTGKVEIRSDSFENFSCILGTNVLQGFISHTKLSSFGFVYLSGKQALHAIPKTIALCLQLDNVPFSDEVIVYGAYFGNKLVSLARLAHSGVRISESVFCVVSNNKNNLDLIEKLGFPLIIKSLNAHQMKGVFVVKTKEELQVFMGKHPDEHFLFQKFIDIANEWRFLVIGGRAISAHNKVPRSYTDERVGYVNPNQWHSFVDVETLSEELVDEAERAAKSLKLDIAGVDVCVDKEDKIRVIEVNRSPGIDYDKDSPEIKGLEAYIEKKLSL